jgi:hypothetical protein
VVKGYYRDLVDTLKAAGCHFIRHGRGDHDMWYSPISKCNFTVDRGSKSKHTANETLKQAGLPKKF